METWHPDITSLFSWCQHCLGVPPPPCSCSYLHQQHQQPALWRPFTIQYLAIVNLGFFSASQEEGSNTQCLHHCYSLGGGGTWLWCHHCLNNKGAPVNHTSTTWWPSVISLLLRWWRPMKGCCCPAYPCHHSSSLDAPTSIWWYRWWRFPLLGPRLCCSRS